MAEMAVFVGPFSVAGSPPEAAAGAGESAAEATVVGFVATPLAAVLVVVVLLVAAEDAHGGVFEPDVDCAGDTDRFAFAELVEEAVADDVVEFAARSRAPVFCCCSRCNLKESEVGVKAFAARKAIGLPCRDARRHRIDNALRLAVVCFLRIP